MISAKKKAIKIKRKSIGSNKNEDIYEQHISIDDMEKHKVLPKFSTD